MRTFVEAEQLLEHEPGVRRALADAAVGDDVLVRGDALVGVERSRSSADLKVPSSLTACAHGRCGAGDVAAALSRLGSPGGAMISPLNSAGERTSTSGRAAARRRLAARRRGRRGASGRARRLVARAALGPAASVVSGAALGYPLLAAAVHQPHVAVAVHLEHPEARRRRTSCCCRRRGRSVVSLSTPALRSELLEASRGGAMSRFTVSTRSTCQSKLTAPGMCAPA